MKNVFNCFALPVALVLLAGASASAPAAQVIPVTVYDQKVAEVNGEAISKIDVEEHMPPGMAYVLNKFRKDQQARGNWNAKMESDWMTQYVPPFKEALRKTIRERLIIQYFKIEKMTLEEKEFQKRVKDASERLAKDPTFKGQFTLPDIEKQIRNAMMIEDYQQVKFFNPLDMPRRPDIEAEYSEHPEKYQRPAGIKVRMIRIDRKVIDPFTGVAKIRDNPAGILEEIRNNIVQFGASFAEEAKNKSNDESRVDGGLLKGANGDSFIVQEEANKVISAAVARLKPGEISPVLEYGKDSSSYVIVLLEERREAGVAPLEEKYDEINRALNKTKTLKREDEWLRATLAKSLIINSTDNQVLTIDFFFPDDKKKKPDFEVKKQP